MKKKFLLLIIGMLFSPYLFAQTKLDSLLPVRGFCIASPTPDKLDEFIKFMEDELVPRKVNTLVLRVHFNYEYESHPELRDENALSKADVKKMVKVCQENNIRIIPQVNLLGHQSGGTNLRNLLKVYPQFDETPHVKMPEKFVWPNDDELYCKSYCPLHPEVHDVVFDLVDEVLEVFEADAFHAGMDEVFYLGDDKCPRCSGRDKAELFAGEVTLIRNHLAAQGKELWIWGDRMIDGKTTGLGMWEASMNQTYRSIDLIPKDVVINDWHYVRAVPTASYFATKGFTVISCPYRIPEVAVKQLESILLCRETSTPQMKEKFAGLMQTTWSGTDKFMDQFYGRISDKHRRGGSAVKCFHALFDEIGKLEE